MYDNNPTARMERVCELPNGHALFRCSDIVGGYDYYSDEVIGMHVWSTSLLDSSTLLCALAEESKRMAAVRHGTHDSEMREMSLDALRALKGVIDGQGAMIQEQQEDRILWGLLGGTAALLCVISIICVRGYFHLG